MRLGGPVGQEFDEPASWIKALRERDYRAAYCPLKIGARAEEMRNYRRAAEAADIVIAEVGAWSNPLADDATERNAALEKCRGALYQAEEIGARCCVNIAGSRGAQWDGPHPENLSEETFEMIVETTREIIDAVQPRRAFYTLEPMPWIFPDSPQSYLRLIRAIDRPQFGVHLDVVNMVSCPARLFHNAAFIRECFALLGPHIVSCHAKDMALSTQLTVHLDEVRPVLGTLDYATFLREAALLPDVPVMLEHLPGAEEYDAAAAHLRAVAKSEGLAF